MKKIDLKKKEKERDNKTKSQRWEKYKSVRDFMPEKIIKAMSLKSLMIIKNYLFILFKHFNYISMYWTFKLFKIWTIKNILELDMNYYLSLVYQIEGCF